MYSNFVPSAEHCARLEALAGRGNVAVADSEAAAQASAATTQIAFGHRYLRQMLVVGAMAVIRYADPKRRPWLAQLLARRKAKVAAVALANKIARTAWAMMMTGERYREPLAA